jgi:flagellin
MSVINTNVNALVAQGALSKVDRQMSVAMERLSTGSRINSAKDDAAGLAISNRMTAQIRGLNQAVRNSNDAISMLQTADGATVEITSMLQRMRELAVQSANDTNGSDDRAYLDLEYAALTSEITKIATNSEWNATALLGTSASLSFTYQVGANSNQTISVAIGAFAADTGATLSGASTGIGLNASITTKTAAQSAIELIDLALDYVSSQRASIGAVINRLQYTVDNLTNVSTNTAQSRSRIQDTDFAETTAELTRTQIIKQASTAMLAQANQQPQLVLSLLK